MAGVDGVAAALASMAAPARNPSWINRSWRGMDFCLILQTGDNQAIFSRSAMPSRLPFVYAFGGLQRQVFRPGGSRAYLILLIFCLFLQVFWRRIGQADELR
jgi:hypothetical protein